MEHLFSHIPRDVLLLGLVAAVSKLYFFAPLGFEGGVQNFTENNNTI